LEQFLKHWLGSSSITTDLFGEMRVLSADEVGCANGQCWTRNGLESRSEGEESLLSSILETGEIDPRFFLKPMTCEKLLARMQAKERDVPIKLLQILHAVATQSTSLTDKE